jgi:ribosomal protein L18
MATIGSAVQSGEPKLAATIDRRASTKQLSYELGLVVVDRGVQKRVTDCVVSEEIALQGCRVVDAFADQVRSKGSEVQGD